MAQYTIKKGDTLTAIAQRLSGMSGKAVYGYLQALISINSIADPNKIFPGQTLNYPDGWTAKTGAHVPVTINMRPEKFNGPPMIRPGTIQTMLKNPMVLGAIALAFLAFMSRK